MVGKTIHSKERALILKVLTFFEREKEISKFVIPVDPTKRASEHEKVNKKFIIPVDQPINRTCAATGIAKSTLMRIKKQMQSVASSVSPVPSTSTSAPIPGPSTPGKKRKPNSKKISLDGFDLVALRNIVNSFYTVKKEVPTLKKILAAAKQDLNFPASPPNKTAHHARKLNNDGAYNDQKPSYRSFQPVIKHKTIYPRHEDRDYDITSYDTEYGGVVSNFTSSIYDDNPQLYPNPEFVARNNLVNKAVNENKITDGDTDMPELPDDSLADADLKEHNIIDSVTYLYGFNNCHGVRNEWMVLIFITSGIATVLLVGTVLWLMCSNYAAEFRRSSKLYPIDINLCCCLAAATQIYIQAVMGVSSPSQCERIALVLHYTHICCAMWIVALAAAVAEYCACDTFLPLKYNYLLAYGVPAVVVMFNYALSMEHYETKHYCWMSIEKGMVMGFMIPAMILILINTAIVILGLQSVNKKQAEVLATKIQELVDHHIANWPMNENENLDKNASIETLDIYTPGSSRKNTDSSENLDKDNYLSEDECTHYPNNLSQAENGTEPTRRQKSHSDRGLLNLLYLDNMSWKLTWNTEGNELKTYLNLCLVLEPFFAVNWVMGVVAIENAQHWSTPTIYLILVVAMYVYLAATICTTLPIVRDKNSPCCESVVTEPVITRTRTTDSIPLLDPTIQKPVVTPAPADTISTISI